MAPEGSSGDPRLPLDPIAEARRQWVAHGWDDAAPGMAAVTSITRAQQLFQQRIDDELRPLDLTFARYELLMLLHFSRRGALPLGVVGSRLQVHPTSVTSAVTRLEHQGFVRRRPHPTDGRAKLAVLTDPGRDVALRATERLNRTVFAATGLGDHATAQLVAILDRLRADAGDFRGAADVDGPRATSGPDDRGAPRAPDPATGRDRAPSAGRGSDGHRHTDGHRATGDQRPTDGHRPTDRERAPTGADDRRR